MIESGFEKEQRQRTEMFARWDVDSALFKAGIGKTRKEDIALVNAAQNKYNSLVDGGIKRGDLGLRAGLGERELDIENQRTGILKQEANAQTMNAETNRLGAITGLSSGLGQPRQQRQTLPGFSSIAPSRLQTSSPFARQRTAGVEAASESEIEDDVDPMRPRAYKKGGVIGNVAQDDGSDKVPVIAREGEYYINPETVAHIGGGDYKQGLRSLNSLVREATGKEPGPSPVGKSGLRGFAAGGVIEDISSKAREAVGRMQPISKLIASAPAGVVQAAPEAAAAPAAAQRGLLGRVLSNPLVAGASLLMHSGEAGAAGEDAWAQQQRKEWGGRELKPGEEPWNNPLPYNTPVVANATREQAAATQAVRSQADEYSDSPERAAWQASLGDGTARQPDTADAFRTRNAAADVYRREWQRQSPGGLRNANPQALDTYNAEQQTRGTGISAQRQANGVMEFSGSGPAPQAQYLDAGGNPTNEWPDTSQYRDAVVRSLGSNDPAMQQRGLAQAMQLQQRNQRGVSTGNPEMDQLLERMPAREAAAVFRALNGGQGADGKGPKATPYGEQQKRVIDALGEEGAAKALPEIQQAQMEMARQLIQSGQATPEQAEVAVSNPQFLTRLTQAYKLRDVLAQNGAAAGAIDQSGLGALGGVAAGLGTLALTKSSTLAKSVGLGAGLAGAAAGGARGYAQGVQGFDSNTPLTGLMNIVPMENGDYQIGNAIVPKSFVQKNYQLFGLTAPPK